MCPIERTAELAVKFISFFGMRFDRFLRIAITEWVPVLNAMLSCPHGRQILAKLALSADALCSFLIECPSFDVRQLYGSFLCSFVATLDTSEYGLRCASIVANNIMSAFSQVFAIQCVAFFFPAPTNQ